MSRRAIVLSELFWPEGGGAELATYLITGILREVFEITVVTGSRDSAVLPGVRYVYEPLLAKREKAFLWLNIYRLMKTERFKKLICKADTVYIPRLAFPAIPYVKGMGKTVVVHLHDYMPLSYSAAILAPYEEHKHRITHDDLKLECGKGVKYCLGASILWWLPKLVRRWITLADRIVCVSRRQAEIIIDLVPELKDKIEVVYNPIPPKLASYNSVKAPSNTPTFLYVGGDRYVKGFHILVEVVKKLGRQGVRAKFILTNTYNQRNLKTLRTLSQRYKNIEINVVGRVNHHELLNLHREAWALIFPSLWEEPLPYSVVESMLAGTIPIASRVGGIPEIVEGTYADYLTFMPGDLEEIVGKIEKVLSLPQSRLINISSELGEIIRRKFNNSALRQRLLKVFSG
jgi:glycosyltransferase involved in cell wall biosynthesis